ncbi:MAG: restriction endonuclease subunit S, partial [Gammaproteobacteria bacterium]|nr:restriction endonuclease subunit S [Gammaproteobacteria bacterium]
MVSVVELKQIPEGYKQTEVGVVPSDWVVFEIQNISKTGSGTTPARAQEDRYFKGGEIFWVKTTDLNNSVIQTTEDKVTDLALKETCLQVYPIGTVLVAMYGGFNQIGRTGILSIPAAVNQALVAVQVNKKIESRYLLDVLNYKVEYWKAVASSSRKDPNITSLDVKRFKLALPPTKTEQTAIAKSLSDVDALITSLEKLVTKKRAIKTAAMQQLLTGKKRLPPFDKTHTGYKQTELGEIPEDWDVTSIEDITYVDPENLNSSTNANYEFDYISLEQVVRGSLTDTTKYKYFEAPSRARRIVRKGDVLVSTVRPNLMSHYIQVTQRENLICSTGFTVLRAKGNCCDGLFLFFHLFAEIINKQIDMLISGSNYPAINSGDVKGLKIPLPSIDEQHEISKILFDMDNEVEALE